MKNPQKRRNRKTKKPLQRQYLIDWVRGMTDEKLPPRILTVRLIKGEENAK